MTPASEVADKLRDVLLVESNGQWIKLIAQALVKYGDERVKEAVGSLKGLDAYRQVEQRIKQARAEGYAEAREEAAMVVNAERNRWIGNMADESYVRGLEHIFKDIRALKAKP